MKGTVRIFKVAVFVAAFTLLSATMVWGALPFVRAGSATVDGQPTEWTTSPPDSSNVDWAAPLCNVQQGCDANHPKLGDLYLRYQCPGEGTNPGTLFVLFLPAEGRVIGVDPDSLNNINNWIKQKNTKLVDDTGAYLTNGVGQNRWRNGTAASGGWLSAEAAVQLPPGNYNQASGSFAKLEFHTNIPPSGGGTGYTGGTGDIDPNLVCQPTAVTLSSFNAGAPSDTLPVAGVIVPAVTIAGLLGLVTVAGVRRIRSR